MFPPTIGRTLVKAGVPAGDKSLLNPSVPEWIGKHNLSEYLKSVFTDEGYSQLRLVKTKGHKFWSVLLHITHGRSKDITEELSMHTIKILEQLIPLGSYISLGRLPQNIKKEILSLYPPKLLTDEIALLDKLKIETTDPNPMRINRTKRNRFSCYWRFLIMQKSIKEFVKRVGFCKETYKQNKLLKQFDLFLRFYGKKLADEDLRKYKLEEF